MKVYKKWLIVLTKEGKRCILTSSDTKQECIELLQYNARQLDKDTWSNGDGSVYTVEKNTKEYKF